MNGTVVVVIGVVLVGWVLSSVVVIMPVVSESWNDFLWSGSKMYC